MRFKESALQVVLAIPIHVASSIAQNDAGLFLARREDTRIRITFTLRHGGSRRPRQEPARHHPPHPHRVIARVCVMFTSSDGGIEQCVLSCCVLATCNVVKVLSCSDNGGAPYAGYQFIIGIADIHANARHPTGGVGDRVDNLYFTIQHRIAVCF